MKKEMLINVLQPEECRIAILEDGILEELYVERTSHESYVGNIYKGRIVNIEPSIQAAFVDFGVGRNGFLHVSDVEPAYYRHLEQRPPGGNGRGRHGQRQRQGGRSGRSAPPPMDEPDVEEIAEEQGTPVFDARNLDLSVPPEEIRVVTVESMPGAPEEPESWSPEPEVGELRQVERAETPPSEPEIPAPSSMLKALPLPVPAESEVSAPLSETETPRGEMGGAAPVASSPPAESPVELGTVKAEEPAKPKRRRTTTRSRKAKAEEPKTEEPAENPPVPETEEKTGGEEPPDDKPRLMESAEHRTKQEDPATETPSTLGSDLTDDDLSFSRRPGTPTPQHSAPPSAPEPKPAPLTVAELDEPDAEEPDRTEPLSFEGELDEFGEVEDRPEFEDLEEEEQPRRRSGRDRDRGDRGGRRRRNGGGGGGGRPGSGRPKPPIQEIFKRGQEVLVQVIKEGIGTKGPTLSTYISIAGRYLVLMPGLNRIGVSRKIQDEDQRRRLRDILSELQPPRGLGFIIRTAGLDRTKKELQRDLAYLSRLWQVVVRRIKKLKAPAEIYQESDMITRTIRDTFTGDIQAILVDEQRAFDHAQEFMQVVMPRYAERIKHYDDPVPLFHKHGIEDEIARIQQRHVPLPNGGSIVIDQTEALVAIDVNSGNFRVENNAEVTAYQMNLHAAKEIARQLRLRDLGGVIVNDFIDMREEKHRRGVERALRDAMKRDRARTKILRISQFGIIEMTRQRIRPSLKRSVYMDCPHCRGAGQVKTCESMSIDVMRLLQLAMHRTNIVRIEVRVHPEVAHYLLNRKRRELHQLEESTTTQVVIHGAPGSSPENLEFLCYDSNNNEVRFLNFDDTSRPRRR